MVTLANNKAINSVGDLEGKIIAAHTFSDFASAQSLFYVMQKSGLHHVTDPKQVIFTGTCTMGSLLLSVPSVGSSHLASFLIQQEVMKRQ